MKNLFKTIALTCALGLVSPPMFATGSDLSSRIPAVTPVSSAAPTLRLLAPIKTTVVSSFQCTATATVEVSGTKVVLTATAASCGEAAGMLLEQIYGY